MSESGAGMRAGDQTWHIGQHEQLAFETRRLGHAKVRAERRERIVADLRSRTACRRQQTRLARVRFADQRRLRDGLQLEVQPALLARLTLLRDPRRAIGARREMRVAQTATPATRDHGRVAGAHQVRRQAIVAAHQRARRHGDRQVLPGLAMLARPASGAALVSTEVSAASELEQRRDAGLRHQVDASAAAAVTTVGAAQRHEFFAPERDDAVAAVSSLHPDARFVDVDAHGLCMPGRTAPDN